MDLSRALREYLNYVSFERGCSLNTVLAYGRDLRNYIAGLKCAGVTLPDQITRERIEAHIQHLRESGLAISSVERAVSAIKGFHRFMVSERITAAHPAADLPLPKKPDRLPDVISRDQAASLLDQPFPETPAGQRDHAIVEVLYGCGLRVSASFSTSRFCALWARATRSVSCPSWARLRRFLATISRIGARSS